MKKILIVAALAVSLAGCASLQTFEQNVSNAWQVVTSASVSPTQIIVAGNAFDVIEATATQYLTYCKANKTQSACALSTRQSVVKWVVAGRTARNQLEPYVTSNTAGPSAIYNTLVAAISSLQTTTPTIGN